MLLGWCFVLGGFSLPGRFVLDFWLGAMIVGLRGFDAGGGFPVGVVLDAAVWFIGPGGLLLCAVFDGVGLCRLWLGFGFGYCLQFVAVLAL